MEIVTWDDLPFDLQRWRFVEWFRECLCAAMMSAQECAECRNLLLQAGHAILAHIRAVSRLEEAVIQNAVDHTEMLRQKVLDTAIARENVVRAYGEHKSSHEMRTKTAGS